MTEYAERERDADAEWRMERHTAEQVPCPRCEQPAGETCQNVATGDPLRKAPAHWQRILAAARRPATPEQEAWDEEWQERHDKLRGRGIPPNAAVTRADHLMDLHNHGQRPTNEETDDA